MIDILERMLYGEIESYPYRQDKKEVAPDVSKESATNENKISAEEPTPTPAKSESDIDSEILTLAKKYGPLHNGVVIEISLQELLALIPRQRRRSDAYSSLQKKLMAEYGTELRIIKSKGGKENGKEELPLQL